MLRGALKLLFPCLLVILGIIIILPGFNPTPEPHADGLGYFAYLPALVSGRPFDLKELAKPEPSWRLRSFPSTGRTVNVWGIGTAIGWLPFYELAHLLQPDLPHNDPRLWLACALASVVFTLVGLLFLYYTLRELAPEWAAFIATLSCLLCTPLIAYASAQPYRSHAFAFMLLSLLLWLLVTKHTTYAWHWLLIGAIVGLLTDTRLQLVFIGILPLILGRPNWRQFSLLGVAFITVFFPQMLMWKMTFGVWLANPQEIVRPGFFHTPAAWHILFSPRHGLFLWHPLLFISSIGLCLALRQPEVRFLSVASLLILISQVILNSMARDWWGGWAFGGRRFSELVPLFAIGLAYLLSRTRTMLIPTALAAWWNVALLRTWLAVHPRSGAYLLPHDAALTWSALYEVLKRLL